MRTDKLKVGVVGVGYLGKFHAEKYAKMNSVTLVGVADINPQNAREVAEKTGCTPHATYEDLLGKVDAVSIAVPTPFHFEVGRMFLENGADILLEKPMTSTLAEADALIRLANEKGRIIQVGLLERYNPAIVALKRIVNTPLYIETRRMSEYKVRGTDVSVILDLMIHDIDIVLKLAGASPERIHGSGIRLISPFVDFATARIEFANGCVANLTASRVSGTVERKIRLIQKDSYISVDFANRKLTVTKKSGKSASGIPSEPDREIRCFEKEDALENELKAFVSAVIQRKTPEVSGQAGREALRVALEISAKIAQASAASGA